MDTIEERITQAGYQLPEIAPAAGAYEHQVRSGNLIILSGGISMNPERSILGKLGADVSLEDGQEAARMCFLNRLAIVKQEIGTLDNLVRIVALNGFVNCTPDFIDQPKVIDGASLLAIELLGDKGRHSRTAVGCASLPLGVAVEISMTVEVC